MVESSGPFDAVTLRHDGRLCDGFERPLLYAASEPGVGTPTELSVEAVAALAAKSATEGWSARRRAARALFLERTGGRQLSSGWALQEHTRKTGLCADWP